MRDDNNCVVTYSYNCTNATYNNTYAWIYDLFVLLVGECGQKLRWWNHETAYHVYTKINSSNKMVLAKYLIDKKIITAEDIGSRR